MLDVCLLGCGGMMPLPNRWLTAAVISCNGKMILIDCGEGTQVTLKMLGWGFKSIEAICFTHYHADHISGLPGMLLTLGNCGRTQPVTLIGPKGLKEIVEGLLVIAPNLPFELNYIELSGDSQEVFNTAGYKINTAPVDHSVPCIAYSLEVLRGRKFSVERALENSIPKELWKVLQRGQAVLLEGKSYTPDMVLGEERKGLKVCYCTDSRPVEVLGNFINGADLFICEGMYGGEESIIKAQENKHMLFSEAATIAQKGKVKELWLTHYSPALTDPREYLINTKNIFDNTVLGEDRMIKTFKFEDAY